ncbi:Eco57I restriction-modification methylase domain-containing protein [Moheibacter stercoris]|uniref:site-specific DNA-methyltransferase (adenine-specific) n=1 Tax=Moheibacter stercoris TaxID=1628251 RepID=A0ABV2LRD3_9FLAO
MSLFQNSVITKHLQSQDKSKIETQWNVFKNHFLNTTIQENIRNSKEEQYQGEFLIDLFVNVLGYTKNPTPNFNLTTEYKNVKDSKKTDGAIVIKEKVKAVIELKGTNTTDLNKIENQAFGYKNNQPDCVYVITSNFEKLRFYIDNATEFLEFNLFELNEKEFELLYLCLAYENIANDTPKKIKEQSLTKEKDITKDLYKDYSNFKSELYQDLVNNNAEFDKLILFKKSQKLIDRFLFLFFAEDRQLLPPNSVRLILSDWKDLQERDVEIPLYERFKKYFGYLNTGYKGKRYDVFAYNGGLFKPDEVLDNVVIDDELLYKHTKKLSNYDFQTEVDVNILGHIFENSLNELDEITAQLEGKQIEKSKTKRKKDGIFYTPKYITKYIVDNTVGKLCTEKKEELKINEEEYFTDRKRTKATKQPLLEKLTNYRNWLLQITICDPACGSGAFLNQALEFLISEHRYIDELQAKLFGDAMVLTDIENSILENNLYGVDLNEESVEIAKLSLWLRTAQPNRKLNDLSHNIKCGNSLIDDTEIAGEKAFNWQNEFPHVFAKGGFDVVIGNPPYVRQELFKDIKPYLEKNYKCYNSIADLYTYFIEKGILLINIQGIFSFILPNKFIKASYGKEIRRLIKEESNIELLYDFNDYPVFEDATTYPIIYVLNKKANYDKDYFVYSEISKKETSNNPLDLLCQKSISVSYKSLNENSWQFQDERSSQIIVKLKKDSISLKELVDDKIFRGVSTGKNEVFIINKVTAERLRNEKNKNFIRKIVTGKEVKRNLLTFEDLYLLFIPWEYDLEFDENIKEYLLENKLLLCNRPEVKEGRFNWWCLSRYGSKNSEFLFKPKIIYPRINNTCNFYYDSLGEYSLSDNNFFISTDEKYILPILNSKLTYFYLKTIASSLQGGYLDFRRPYVETIPIKIPNNKFEFEKLSEYLIKYNNQLQEQSQRFQRTIQRKFELEDLPKKLQEWYLLSYAEFIKELAKKKIKLSLSEEAEWEDYFTTEAKKVLAIKNQIDTTDKEIDKMVYQLYGLTDEEIEIIENS